VWRFPLQPLNGDATGWPALAAALRELSRVLGVEGGRLDVALMPPLTEIRRLELPRMGETELRMLLSRNAPRYFVGARSAQLVGTALAPAREADSVSGVMAAATPLRLVTAMHAAARDAGWTIDAVSPAEGAWTAASAALWPATSRLQSHLLVCGTDRTELLQLDRGRLASVRHFRGGAADAALVAAAVGRGPVGAVGDAAQRKELARALSAAGVSVAPPPEQWAAPAESADFLAAEFAGPKAVPLLRSDATLASRRDTARTSIVRALTAAGILLLLSALFEFVGAKRQLKAVEAERAAIKPRLSVTLVGRTSVETAYRQLAALAAAQRGSIEWSGVIARLATSLDDNSYLTTLRARDDSLVVDGIAAHAARAFDSIALTPGLTSVKAAAPVRREAPEGSAPVERFSIAAVVAHPGAAVAMEPPHKGAP
jgi:hypothetical protein